MTKIAPNTHLAHACESADLAYFTSDCDAQLLYTDAAPVLYASRRVAVTARSGVLDVYVHDVVEPRTQQAKETPSLDKERFRHYREQAGASPRLHSRR